MTTRSIPDPAGRGPTHALALAAILAFATLPACSPKITAVDSDYQAVEGSPSPFSHLVLWADEGATSYYYQDEEPPDPDEHDVLIGTNVLRAYPAGTLRGMVLDSTMADEYEVFRREPGGGFRQFESFDLLPTRKWLGTQTEVYSFVDEAPSGYAPPTYVARGLVGDVATPRSPLSNEVRLLPGGLQNIQASAIWFATNGKLKLTWLPVPDAERYLVQVYTFRSDMRSNAERFASGIPTLLFDGKVTDSFVGIVPSNPAVVAPNLYLLFVGDSSRTDVQTIFYRSITYGSAVFCRIAALDHSNHLIALTLGNPDPIAAFRNGDVGIQRNALGTGTYLLYRLSATTARDTAVVPPGGGEGN